MQTKIIVVGGGPGGYSAAIKAAQLGAEVTLVEASKLGGTCLNVGCIPTKALLRTSEFYRLAATNSMPGVNIGAAEIDWSAALRHKDEVVVRLTGGVGALLRHNGVTVRNGNATVLSGRRVKLGDETLSADAIILATGSYNTKLSSLNIPGTDLPGVIDSTAMLALDKLPKSVVITGGGVIGCEFATLLSGLGVKVTIIEMAPEILPAFDREIASLSRAALTELGVDVVTGAKLTSIEKVGRSLSVTFYDNGSPKAGGTKHIIKAEKVLEAVGRKPMISGAGLEDIGLKLSNGAVGTDDLYRTNIPNLYAVGDCNGKSMLAHAAMAQGESVAEYIMLGTASVDHGVNHCVNQIDDNSANISHDANHNVGHNVNHKTVPACVYMSPEIACVGLTEEEAAAQGIDYAVGLFDLSGNAKSVIEGHGGLCKIIADREYGELLGVHIIGARASELIAAAALCINMEGTAQDIAATIHSHPTISEAFRESAMSVFGKPIHGI